MHAGFEKLVGLMQKLGKKDDKMLVFRNALRFTVCFLLAPNLISALHSFIRKGLAKILPVVFCKNKLTVVFKEAASAYTQF